MDAFANQSVLVNVIGGAAGLLSMSSFVPQLLKLMRGGDASGVSLRTYVFAVTGFVLWTSYGFLLGSAPLVVTNLVNLCLTTAILTFTLRRRAEQRKPLAQAP